MLQCMNCRCVVLCLNGRLVNVRGLYHCTLNTFRTHTFLSYTIYCMTIQNTFCIDTFQSYTIYSAVCCSYHSAIAFLPHHVTCSIFCNLPPIYIPLTLVPANNFRWHMVLLLLCLTNTNGGMWDHKNGWKDQQDLGVWVNFFSMWNIKPSARPSHVQNCIWWKL